MNIKLKAFFARAAIALTPIQNRAQSDRERNIFAALAGLTHRGLSHLWRLPKKQFVTLLLLIAAWPEVSIGQGISAGMVTAWGSNESGQTDVPAAAQSGVTAVAAGAYHSLALKEDGSVVAWGSDPNVAPAPLAARSGVVAIAARGYCSLALKNDGSVVGWGSWAWRPNTTVPAEVTIPVEARTDVIAIAAGSSHALALRANGSVLAWGSHNLAETIVPAGLSNVIAIAAGDSHSVALKADGSVAIWGRFWNNSGATTNALAVPPAAQSGVRAIAAGGNYTVAVKVDGSLVVWGGYYNGGIEVPAAAMSGVTAVAAGGTQGGWSPAFIVALKEDGTIVAWGYDRFGVVSLSAGLSGVMAVAAGDSHVLAVGTPTAPMITTLPASPTVTVVQRVTFNVSATGFPLHYQWRKNGQDIFGATMPAYSPGFSDVSAEGSYTVVVSNSSGSVTSAPPAVLNVVPTEPGTVLEWGNVTGLIPLQAQGNIVAIAAGGGHSEYGTGSENRTLALTRGGSVVQVTEIGLPLPPEIQGNFVAVAAGQYYSLALKNDGSVWEWSQFGEMEPSPAAVQSDVVAIATDGGNPPRNAALKRDGSVIAWARECCSDQIIVQVAFEAQSGVIAIAFGNYQLYGLKIDGTVKGWNWEEGAMSDVPADLSGVKAISGGWNHMVALKNDGSVVAWGSDAYGQLDIPPQAQSGVTAIAAGGLHTLALKEDGSVVAWGFNRHGQCNVPAGLSGVTAIAAAYGHSVALLGAQSAPRIISQPSNRTILGGAPASFSVTASGFPLSYQWRKNGTDISGATGAVLDLGPANPSQVGNYSVVVSNPSGSVTSAPPAMLTVSPSVSGTVVAWGNNGQSQSTVPGGLDGVVAIAAGGVEEQRGHSLALKSDGTVVAWGDNGQGQSTVPDGLNGVIAIAAGGYHSLALKSDGTVMAWGADYAGQSTVPGGLTGVIAIAAGFIHSVALKMDGTVVVWGGDDYGALAVPAGLNAVIAIAAGGLGTLALKSDGTVVGWGYEGFSPSAVPGGLTGVVAIAQGGVYGQSGYSLALKSDGAVVATGNNDAGQSNVPDGLNGVVAIAAGGAGSLALKSDGTIVVWGTTGAAPGGLNDVIAIARGYSHSLALIAAPSAIVVQASADKILLSWPLFPQGFTLQSTTNLTDHNSWTTLTNSPVMVDSQNRVTDPISGPAKFYRLKK